MKCKHCKLEIAEGSDIESFLEWKFHPGCFDKWDGVGYPEDEL